MKDLIDVFRMDEVDPKIRARIIIKLGNAINYTYGANITEPIVHELVSLLDPDNEEIQDARYAKPNH